MFTRVMRHFFGQGGGGVCVYWTITMMSDTVFANVHGLYLIPHAGVGLTACISIVMNLSFQK